MASSDPLPGWSDYLSIMAKAQRTLDLLIDPSDPRARQEVYRLMFAALATGYHSAFADPDHPDFVPVVSNVLNTIGVNPDFIYGYTPLDGTGSYRLSGIRGNAVFILVDFVAGGLGVADEPGPSVGTLDIDQLTVDVNGCFEVLLSAERPAGHRGDWFRLNPATRTASLRRAYYHWGEGQDCTVALERIDRSIRADRLEASEIAQRLERLAGYVERYVNFALAYGHRQRAQDFVNRLEHDDWAGRGGVKGQHYYQGIFDLRPGEAMIVETELPQRVRYWNIQVNDPLWNAIDWLNHQSSLNGAQAVIDADGKFRAVISVDDPGVPNWLDPGGHARGSLMLRWTEASSGPEPSVKIVPATDLRRHLPRDTATITTEARRESLRKRRRGAQLRHRW